MIYSSADFMGIPWEVIIKSYRNALGKKSFDTLSEHAGDFLNYLSKFPYFSEKQMQDYLKSCCFDVFSHVLSWILGDLRKEFHGKADIEDAQIEAVINAAFKAIKEKMKSVDDEKQIRVDEDFIDNNMEIINEMLEIVFENYKLSKKQQGDVITILKLNFQKCGWMDKRSGIVIAGYGEREIFPSIHDFCVSGKLGKSVIYFNENIDSIDGFNSTASIAPYAQSDVVHQFVRGIDRDFADRIGLKFDEILDALSEHLTKEKSAKTQELKELFEEFISRTIDSVYIKPIMDIVGSMEKLN